MDLTDVPGLDSGSSLFAKAQHYATRGAEAQKITRKRARTEPFAATDMVGILRESNSSVIIF